MTPSESTRKLARKLRRVVPPMLPVRVYVKDVVTDDNGKACGGTAHAVGGDDRWTHFVVEVTRAEWPEMRRVLVHEWAHCLSWEEGEARCSDHGDLFKRAQRRIRAVLGREKVA